VSDRAQLQKLKLRTPNIYVTFSANIWEKINNRKNVNSKCDCFVALDRFDYDDRRKESVEQTTSIVFLCLFFFVTPYL